MMSSMTNSDLRKWCDAKRGRLSLLARELNCSRQFVWAMAEGKRPIPPDTVRLLAHEMRRAERAEAEELEAA